MGNSWHKGVDHVGHTIHKGFHLVGNGLDAGYHLVDKGVEKIKSTLEVPLEVVGHAVKKVGNKIEDDLATIGHFVHGGISKALYLKGNILRAKAHVLENAAGVAFEASHRLRHKGTCRIWVTSC